MSEHHPAVVVGAGPAGLAASAVLKTHRVEHVVIERADRVGASWHRHYDRLHLHTTRRISGLPYRGFPPGDRYPSRDEVCAYFADYARHFDIRPRFGVELVRAARRDGRWELDTSDGPWTTDRLVIATGTNRVPVLPELPGLDGFAGPVIHSSDFRSGADFAGQRVLVVGCGNSGAEIALDLWEHGARPTMVVRGPVHVMPRDLFGLRPSSETSVILSELPTWLADLVSGLVAPLAVGDLSRWGIERPRTGIYTMIREQGRVPLLDIGTIEAIRRGDVAVAPAVTALSEGHATFADGSERPFDAIVLATGFKPRIAALIDGIEPLLDRRGLPDRHGVEVLPGLHFVGFANPPAGALRGIRLDALRMGEQLAATLPGPER